MKEMIFEHEERTGRKVKLVVVDYLECIPCKHSDPTAASGYNANALKDMSTECDVCTLLLLQTQKSSGDVSEPLLSMRKVKGASVIEQACSVILSIWREGFSPETFENDITMSFAAVKSRLGPLFQADFGWDGLTGSVYELGESEKEDLAELRAGKKKLAAIAGL
jgi:hypothetical protein